MKLSRWLVIGMLATSTLCVLVATAFWWVTWPERTARSFLNYAASDGIAGANQFLANGKWEIKDDKKPGQRSLPSLPRRRSQRHPPDRTNSSELFRVNSGRNRRCRYCPGGCTTRDCAGVGLRQLAETKEALRIAFAVASEHARARDRGQRAGHARGGCSRPGSAPAIERS